MKRENKSKKKKIDPTNAGFPLVVLKLTNDVFLRQLENWQVEIMKNCLSLN